MGLFDTYEPKPQACPVCGHPLVCWQGKDGPCGLFVWREGCAAPVGQDVDDEVALLPAERDAVRLPDAFVIGCWDCPDHRPVFAEGRCVDGVWQQTRVVAGRP